MAQWLYPFFALYTTSLSSLSRCIWRRWISKILVRYILLSVCFRLCQFSQLSFMQYMGLCVSSLSTSLMVIVRMYTLSYYHHQIRSMTDLPLFRLTSWNNGICSMFFYILILIGSVKHYGHTHKTSGPQHGKFHPQTNSKCLIVSYIIH